jgi:translation initiation factor 3 subunit I
LKTYVVDRPVNAAVISPRFDHVLLGGGQEAHSVTTTRGETGKFETRMFEMIYQTEFGRIGGHFGPINAMDVSPSGLSYASGSEDGMVRLHFFDDEFIFRGDPVPADF